jgi:hypothetical protein
MIKAVKGHVNYELALPPDARIHPVFHISLLEPANAEIPLQTTFRYEPDEEEYEVEKIRKHLGTLEESQELPAASSPVSTTAGKGRSEENQRELGRPSVALQVKGDKASSPGRGMASSRKASLGSSTAISFSSTATISDARPSKRASCFMSRCSLAMASEVAARAASRRDNNSRR